MKLVLLSQCCGGGDCPALFRTDRDTYIIQGWKLDNEARQSVQPTPAEDAVEIPAALLEELVRRFKV